MYCTYYIKLASEGSTSTRESLPDVLFFLMEAHIFIGKVSQFIMYVCAICKHVCYARVLYFLWSRV